MVIDTRAKGARTELSARDILREASGLEWERTPASGALDAKHGMKGDLYVPGVNTTFCVEVKGYEEDHLTSSVLTSKSPQLLKFWHQAVRQAEQVNKEPLLIFKYNRSKFFVAFTEMPKQLGYDYLQVVKDDDIFFVALLEEWLRHEQPKFKH